MRLRVTAILAACALLVGSCASDSKDNKAQSGSQSGSAHPANVAKLRLAGGDYGYPSPFAYVRGAGLILCSSIFDTLLWQDSTGEAIPWLAQGGAHSPDGLEWGFTPRDNPKRPAGQPLTA